jgi:hypothetical protein
MKLYQNLSKKGKIVYKLTYTFSIWLDILLAIFLPTLILIIFAGLLNHHLAVLFWSFYGTFVIFSIIGALIILNIFLFDNNSFGLHESRCMLHIESKIVNHFMFQNSSVRIFLITYYSILIPFIFI